MFYGINNVRKGRKIKKINLDVSCFQRQYTISPQVSIKSPTPSLEYYPVAPQICKLD